MNPELNIENVDPRLASSDALTSFQWEVVALICFETKSALRGSISAPVSNELQCTLRPIVLPTKFSISSHPRTTLQIKLFSVSTTTPRPFTEHAENNLANPATIQLM